MKLQFLIPTNLVNGDELVVVANCMFTHKQHWFRGNNMAICHENICCRLHGQAKIRATILVHAYDKFSIYQMGIRQSQTVLDKIEETIKYTLAIKNRSPFTNIDFLHPKKIPDNYFDKTKLELATEIFEEKEKQTAVIDKKWVETIDAEVENRNNILAPIDIIHWQNFKEQYGTTI